MTKTLYINGEDYTSIWRQEESSFTSRAHMGEVAQSEFVLDDDDGTLDHLDLASRKIVELWEDASGYPVCIYRGRMMNHTLARGDIDMGVAMAWTCSAEDYNIDLRGIRVTISNRPEEDDVTRVLAYAAGYLAGSASTNDHARDSTDLGTTYVINADTVTLPAETYRYTYPNDIFQRIVENSGKTFFVFVDDTGDGQLYYASLTDTTFASDISIDDTTAADGEDSYAPIYIGPAGDHDGQHVISGGGMEYLNGSGFYEESDISGGEGFHDKWEEHLTDDFVTTETNAAALLSMVVGSRSNEKFSYSCSIKMQASEVHRIKAGMTLTVRLAAANLTTPATLRAVQVTYEPTDPGWYLVHLELGWPRDRPLRRNQRLSPPRAPTQPTPPTPGGSARLYHTDYRAGSGDSTEALAAPALSATDADADWDDETASFGFYRMLYATPQSADDGQVSFDAVNLAVGDYAHRGYLIKLDNADLLAIIQGGGTFRGQNRANSRSGIGINESAQNNVIETCGRIYRPGTGFVADLWEVGDATGDLKFAAQTTSVNRSFGGSFTAYASAVSTDYLAVDYGFHHAGPTSGGTGAGLRFNDTAASDLPEDQSTTTNLRSWIEFVGTGSEGSPGDVPEPVGSVGAPGDETGTYAPIDHVHAHGLLSTSETRYHDDTHIEVTGTDGVKLGANVADALDVLASKLDGGTDGQVLTKQSDDDYDVDWETPSGGGAITVEGDSGSVADVTTVQIVGAGGASVAVSDEGSGTAKATVTAGGGGGMTDPTTTVGDLIVYANGSYEDIILAEADLVSYWRLGETSSTFADSKGSNDLVVNGSPTRGVAGAVVEDDKALEGGGSGYAVNASPSSIPVGSSARTVEFWWKGTTGSKVTILSYGVDSTRRSFGVAINQGGSGRIGVWTWGNDLSLAASSVRDGNWHHIAIVYGGGSSIEVYLDGTSIGTLSYGGTLNTGASALYVGRDWNAGGNYLSGVLDELAIYDSALDATTIASHASSTGASSGPSRLPVGTDGSYLRAASSKLSGVEYQKNNLAATTAPTTGDDAADGYSVGSLWLDTTNSNAYLCFDPTVASAVWVIIT